MTSLGFVILLGLAAVFGLLVTFAVMAVQRGNAPYSHQSRAYLWADRRSLTLTDRSVPFVDTYLRNARALRFVCAAGALLLATAWSYGTAIDLGGIFYAWVLAGYLVGSVWAELSLARVPAAPTREASLRVRDPRAYVRGWLFAAQFVLPVALAALALYALANDPLPDHRPMTSVTRWTVDNARTHAIVAGGLGLVSLAVTVLAQRHIVRRPQPRSEPDLVAADEAMRTSAVHVLGVTHVVLCLLLAIAGLLHVGHTNSGRADVPVAALIMGLVIAALILWCLRLQTPGMPGGPVAPPPFPPEAAAAVDVSAPGSTWVAPRRPDLAALVVISVLAIGLWGLRWIGPVNPDVSPKLSALSQPYGKSPSTPEAQDFELSVTNRSLLDVEVEEIVFGPDANAGHPYSPGPGRADPPVVLSQSLSGAVIAGGGESRLPFTIQAPPCPGDAAMPTSIHGFPMALRLRTAVGRVLTVGLAANAGATLQCRVVLPTGPQPDDPVAARAGVERAFSRTYHPTPEDEDTPVLIDHPEGLKEPSERAPHTPTGRSAAGARLLVTQVGFDRPDHAAVIYEFRQDGRVLITRRGEAVLVDGVWKVTRGTVCGDLALVGAPCP
jgi:hypothetical protein